MIRLQCNEIRLSADKQIPGGENHGPRKQGKRRWDRMKRIRILLILQAAVCVLLAILLGAGAICICRLARGTYRLKR